MVYREEFRAWGKECKNLLGWLELRAQVAVSVETRGGQDMTRGFEKWVEHG